MSYNKPEIVIEGSGLKVIQGQGVKDGCENDHTSQNSNGCAYEADE
jgi:hypothetical protein